MKFIVLFLVFTSVVGVTICSITYRSYSRSMFEHYSSYAEATAHLAAALLDTKKLLEYAESLQADRDYFDMLDRLKSVRTSMGVKYLYVQMPVSDSEYIYLLDADDPGDDLGDDLEDGKTSLGVRGEIDDTFTIPMNTMITGVPLRRLDITHSEYGYLASAYTPLKDDRGVPFAWVGVDIAMENLLIFLRRYLTHIIIATMGVVVISFTALFLLIRRSVVDPVTAIAKKTVEFSQNIHNDDFEKLEIASNDEIGLLADSVNKMFDDIRGYTVKLAKETAQKERAQSELDMARSIQENVLPRTFPPFPNIPNVEICASMKAAREVGGDFYDFFVIDDEHLALVIADVSGKGIPAALFMMVARTLLRNQLLTGEPLQEVLRSVNNQLCQNNEATMFVTALVGIYNRKTHCLRYANAGHNPPVLRNGQRRAEWLPVNRGFVLAGMEDMEYIEQEVFIGESDCLILYTDGVTEAMNEEEELFGNDRLLALISDIPGDASAREFITEINEAVLSFEGNAEQTDDITLLALRRL
ncbi:MAG: SpoIIE family protein phosphatase [Synergistaceae bacterium]|nr:SpoIIE family protein phosphatase [Synergistaceae bacterium]